MQTTERIKWWTKVTAALQGTLSNGAHGGHPGSKCIEQRKIMFKLIYTTYRTCNNNTVKAVTFLF